MGNCCPSFLRHFRSTKKSTSKYRILLLGIDGAGKTEVLHNLWHKQRTDYAPTIGCNIHPISYMGTDIILTELGGSADIRGIWKHYYQEVHGCIFVIDSSDHARLPMAQRVLSNIFLNSKLSGKPILLLGTKQDLTSALDYLDLCAYLDIDRLANVSRTPCYVATIGVAEQTGLTDGMRWLLACIETNRTRINNQNTYFSYLENNDDGGGGGRVVVLSDGRPKTSRGGAKSEMDAIANFVDRPRSAPALSKKLKLTKRISPSPIGGDVHLLEMNHNDDEANTNETTHRRRTDKSAVDLSEIVANEIITINEL